MERWENEGGMEGYEFRIKKVLVDVKARPCIRGERDWDLTEKVCRGGSKITDSIVKTDEISQEVGNIYKIAMAVRGDYDSSANFLKNERYQKETRALMNSMDLTYDEKRMRCTNTIEGLQNFVTKILAEQGTWSPKVSS